MTLHQSASVLVEGPQFAATRGPDRERPRLGPRLRSPTSSTKPRNGRSRFSFRSGSERSATRLFAHAVARRRRWQKISSPKYGKWCSSRLQEAMIDLGAPGPAAGLPFSAIRSTSPSSVRGECQWCVAAAPIIESPNYSPPFLPGVLTPALAGYHAASTLVRLSRHDSEIFRRTQIPELAAATWIAADHRGAGSVSIQSL